MLTYLLCVEKAVNQSATSDFRKIQIGIERAIKLMETGRLYRYNFNSEFREYSDKRILNGELAGEVTQVESEFNGYTGHKYAICCNYCGSALIFTPQDGWD